MVCGAVIVARSGICGVRGSFEFFIISFLTGWGIFSALFAFFGFLGMPLNLMTGLILLAVIYTVAKCAKYAVFAKMTRTESLSAGEGSVDACASMRSKDNILQSTGGEICIEPMQSTGVMLLAMGCWVKDLLGTG